MVGATTGVVGVTSDIHVFERRRRFRGGYSAADSAARESLGRRGSDPTRYGEGFRADRARECGRRTPRDRRRPRRFADCDRSAPATRSRAFPPPARPSTSQGVVGGGGHFRIKLLVKEGPGNTDTQRPRPLPERARIVGRRDSSAGWVMRVVIGSSFGSKPTGSKPPGSKPAMASRITATSSTVAAIGPT